jgi:hypothetical protein
MTDAREQIKSELETTTEEQLRRLLDAILALLRSYSK